MARRNGGIDLEAVICVDLGHKWTQTFLGRADSGKLRGLPIREVVCDTCGSARQDHLTWGGVVTSRTYAHDPAYIDNARALDSVYSERRRHYREELCKRIRTERIRAIEEQVSA